MHCPTCGAPGERDPERAGVAWCLLCWEVWVSGTHLNRGRIAALRVLDEYDEDRTLDR